MHLHISIQDFNSSNINYPYGLVLSSVSYITQVPLVVMEDQ